MTADGAKDLWLDFNGRIIEHLGIQMYQSPVAAIAEIISNAWDADATEVKVTINHNRQAPARSSITIWDDGHGMTFDECQNRYLNVGYCRRHEHGERTKKGRKPLGRKGIGKFAGFGIANKMTVKTISEDTGELTVFVLDLDELSGIASDGNNAKGAKKIKVLRSDPPSEANKDNHGTEIVLSDFKGRMPRSDFAKSMARRFLFYQNINDFSVLIDGAPLPVNTENPDIEYEFPKDYTDKEKEAITGLELIDEDGIIWGKECVSDDEQEILWRIAFYKTPLSDEEMRGVSIFAGVKIAQLPFFFELSGSISAGHALQYMAGKIQADYLDEMPIDVIATERQRINWEINETAPLKNWGQKRIRELTSIWKKRRAQEKIDIVENKLSSFADRLGKLQPNEQKTVKTAMTKLAAIESIDDQQFQELCGSILFAWEKGRLRGLIEEIATTETMTPDEFLKILHEASVLSALNIAESIKTKIGVIDRLEVMISQKVYENNIRDFIAENPWLISQKWETFKKETALNHIFEQAIKEAKIDKDEDWNGRIDLALRSGDQLLVLEFMRPNLTVDDDHLNRIENYIASIREQIKQQTALEINTVTGYMVADKLGSSNIIRQKIQYRKEQGIYAMSWDTLLEQAKSDYQEYISILVSRSPDDPRVASLK